MNLLIDNPVLHGNINWFGLIVFCTLCGICVWVLWNEKQ